MKSQTIAIVGGSGAGKSSVTAAVIAALGPDMAAAISEDNYYRDLEFFGCPVSEVDWDHPRAKDFGRLADDVKQLKAGFSVTARSYSFTSARCDGPLLTIPAVPYLLLDGMYCLYDEDVSALVELKIFFEVDQHTRFARRAKRDLKRCDRSVESTAAMWRRTVEPAFQKYIAVTKNAADIVFENSAADGVTDIASQVVQEIRERLQV